MHNITFSLPNLHLHGPAFFEFLALRKSFFVDGLKWEVPSNDAHEMDQYDNPTAIYSLVIEQGRVIGGARATPTDAKWGEHSYMLRDAMLGKLPGIPSNLLPVEIRTSDVWECTRLVIADDVECAQARRQCLTLIVDGLARHTGALGASKLMSLSPITLMRSLRQLGFDAERISEPYNSEEDGRRYAVLAMSAHAAPELEVAEAA